MVNPLGTGYNKDKEGIMKLLEIRKAKKYIKELNLMVAEISCLSQLDGVEKLSINEKEVEFKYGNVVAKLKLDKNGKPYLYTLFDIYSNKKLLESAYHYSPSFKKTSFSTASMEFSRSGTQAPGPC